jgi:hypothetical protein
MRTLRLARVVVLASAFTLPIGCSANDGGAGYGQGTSGNGGASPSPSSTTAPPDQPPQDAGLMFDGPAPSNEGGPLPESETCYADTQQAERAPLAMYIMMDKSGSMTDVPQPFLAPLTTKWIAVKNALGGFLSDPASAGISVAIQFFPLPAAPYTGLATCTAAADCADQAVCVSSSMSENHCYPRCTSSATCGKAECLPLNTGDKVCGNDTCEASTYATPEVDFTALPAAQGPIMAALNSHQPTTATPTLPALTGAVDHAKAWAADHPDHKVVVVLATDGLPTVCPVDAAQGDVVQMVADVAASGVAGSPSVRTFVIGIAGPMDGSAPNLEKIAQAGGTAPAIIVQANADVAQQFAAALEMIRGAALACEFQIPSTGAGPLDYDRVNVLYSNGSAQDQTVYYVGDAASCDPQHGGWHYDVAPEDGTPTRIVLCPVSCDAVQGDNAASVAISIGCETQMIPK